MAGCLLLLLSQPALADRIKDLASIQGVRNNQLIGYGIVVGPDSTGDRPPRPFTTQAIANMFGPDGGRSFGRSDRQVAAKNVAAVMVTANPQAFAKPGSPGRHRVVHGNAKSLRGGTCHDAL